MKWLRQLHHFLEIRLFYPVAASSALALGLLAARDVMGDTYDPYFLVWNIFLAWVPYMAALWAALIGRRQPQATWQLLPAGLIWLAFFPNAPYLMTDLVHLQNMDFVWWYDIGMLLAFAWAGGLLGVVSLHIMQGLVRQRAGAIVSWLFVLVSGVLCGLGVYVGRFLRWNSWDLLMSPDTLIRDTMALLGNPDTYPQMIGVSGLFASFILVGYMTLSAARRAR